MKKVTVVTAMSEIQWMFARARIVCRNRRAYVLESKRGLRDPSLKEWKGDAHLARKARKAWYDREMSAVCEMIANSIPV